MLIPPVEYILRKFASPSKFEESLTLPVVKLRRREYCSNVLVSDRFNERPSCFLSTSSKFVSFLNASNVISLLRRATSSRAGQLRDATGDKLMFAYILSPIFLSHAFSLKYA